MIVLYIIPCLTGEKWKQNKENKKDWCYSDYAVGIAVGAAAVAATPFVLGAAGFTAGGVAAGSVAACVQSAIYGGAVGSGTVFAALQSAGAAGIGMGAKLAISTTVAGAATYIKKKMTPCNGEAKCSSGDDS